MLVQWELRLDHTIEMAQNMYSIVLVQQELELDHENEMMWEMDLNCTKCNGT